MEKKDIELISSVDLLKRTGLSRATMNNYIKAGILPRPIVKRPDEAAHSSAKRIGYFPDSVLSTLDEITQYKQEHRSMKEICDRLTLKSAGFPAHAQIKGTWMTTSAGIRSHDRGGKKGCESGDLFLFEESRSGDVPIEPPAQGASASAQERTVQDLFKQRMPIPLTFSVMAADLQDSLRICDEMPPEEYLRLISQIWISAKSAFKKYLGVYGKHPANGLLYYFMRDGNSNYLMNPILCAIELREQMKKLSDKWKQDKGWYEGLFLNMGISEGYEYFGKISAAPKAEIITLGDTVNYALRLSGFARCGSIWTTKRLLTRLDEMERAKVRYGIRRGQHNNGILLENTFSRIADLIPHDGEKSILFKDISTMTVTEIRNLR